jgi:Skp family chaperone for outer membrane proteins
MRRLLSGLFVLALLAAQVPVLAEQATATTQGASVTDRDLQRLTQALADATAEVNRGKSRDAATANRLSRELDELSDEVAYLRVKLRKEGRASRAEYFDLRDRIDDLRARASADTATAARRDREVSDRTIPVGTEIDVRLQDALSSGRNQVEDRFVGTTVVDLQLGERVVIPAGSEVRGVITAVEKAGRLDRKGSLTLAFDSITVNGRERDIRGVVTDTIESEGIRGEVGKIGGAAGVGAIIGGILGGVKGAITGILIGGGGMIAATEGKDVELESGTILRVRLDQPPVI